MAMPPPTWTDAQLDAVVTSFQAKQPLPPDVRQVVPVDGRWQVSIEQPLGHMEVVIRLPAPTNGRHWHQVPPQAGTPLGKGPV